MCQLQVDRINYNLVAENKNLGLHYGLTSFINSLIIQFKIVGILEKAVRALFNYTSSLHSFNRPTQFLQNLPFLFRFLVFDATFMIFSSIGQKCWLGGSFKLIDLMSKTWPSPAASETSWKLCLAFTLNLKFDYILMHESNIFCSKKTV